MSSPAHGEHQPASAPRRRRRARRWVLIMLALIALLLWKLNVVIAALGSVQSVLEHAQGIRPVLVELVSRLYHAIATTVHGSPSR